MAKRRIGKVSIGKMGWAVIALVGFALMGFAAQSPRPAPNDLASNDLTGRAAQPVRITRVALAPEAIEERYTGTIRPQQEVPLAFRIAGKLIARGVDVGDRVAAGQILATLDATDAQLERDAAKAEETAARSDLARAEAELARSRDLFATGHIAKAAFDRATSAAAEALSRADRAGQMRALAENKLSYMSLVAEAEGIVTATFVEAGQVVGAGQPVVSLAQGAARDVVFALPEQSRALLDTAGARAALWGVADKDYALSLRDISPDVDSLGRTYRVRMTLAAPDAEAALGRTVTVRLTAPAADPASAAPVAALPIASVMNDGAGAAVWRLPQGADHVERVPVALVALRGDVALVRGALAQGDSVVSLGATKIDPARPVRVVETAPTPES